MAAGHHPCCSGTARSHKTPQAPCPHALYPSHKQRSTGAGLTLPHHGPWGKRWGPLAGISKPPAPTGQGRGPRCPAAASWCLLHCISWGSPGSAPLCPAAPTPHRATARGGGGRKNTEGCQPAAEFGPAGAAPLLTEPCGTVTEGQRSAASSCPPQQGGSGRSAGWRCCWQGPSPGSWMTAAPNYYSSFSFSRLRREAASREVGCPRAGSVPKANRRGRVPAGFQLFNFFFLLSLTPAVERGAARCAR